MNKLFVIVISVIVVVVLLSSYIILSQTGLSPSGQSSQTSQPEVTNSPGSNSPSASPQILTEAVRYKTVNFVDTQGIGTKAFSMLIPEKWQSSGNISWVLDNPAMPAFGSFRAWNPNGAEEYNYHANQAFFWSTNQMLLQTFPVGTHYFGAEVRETLGPAEALKEIALPAYRNGARQ